MIFRLRRLERNTPEIKEFHGKFCSKIKYEVPLEYFNSGDCFAMYVGKRLIGGFCLVNTPPLHLRSILQIEDIYRNWYLYDSFLVDVCEFTGYFLEDRRWGLIFTMYLVWSVLFYKSEQFVYSYPVSQKGLERYYGYGDPVRLYTGIPSHLKDFEGIEEEHVEVLTKWGIVKIFLRRTLRYFSWRRYGKKYRRDASVGI
jgi:hypothetical protein